VPADTLKHAAELFLTNKITQALFKMLKYKLQSNPTNYYDIWQLLRAATG
jgi:hypothetical protein